MTFVPTQFASEMFAGCNLGDIVHQTIFAPDYDAPHVTTVSDFNLSKKEVDIHGFLGFRQRHRF